ncbi:NACHT domain-containing protein [Streptomyces aquilus]|uniref:NACHT domain-containing protein n=1 Tax=Streptomyces aquilus TaxID=2548456 RepID=A0A3Q9C5Z9_9ACTN|nr:NACHT domain-containing protein [Streptomyces aquilus]AZP14738.1 NACHT domain-containing protein [Streptomyces aquilus]AZP22966.1 NACHT domain-containing protein [Streptomyces aquilus]
MAGLGGRRWRRRWQMFGALGALAVVASVAYAMRQLLHGGLEPGDTAGLLGLPLGVIGLVVSVVALRNPVEGNDAERSRGWAATLAKQVEDGESGVWRQLLGDDTRRINLAYDLQPAVSRPAVALAAGRLTADGANSATVPDIVSYYRATQPLRLVITGAAGAGKTVLALELLLALLDGRAEDDPVPVRIPLSRWDTERQLLPDLLRQRLVEAYDWPTDLAAGLVRQHLVLPVLDGLDEMDPLVDGSPDPAAPRATAVVRALNAYQQGRDAGPLILTCRTRHYDALATHAEVLDAARITIAPVDATDARTYLTDRALTTDRWQPLLDHLAAHPSGLLATVLSTPWRLCLTATVYHRDGDPGELRTLLDASTLDDHLLARYIPAATRIAPNPHGYAPKDVHRWLHHLTTHLDPTGALPATAPTSVEATDLLLHELWPLAGRTRVRTTDAVLTTLAVLPSAWTAPLKPTGLAALITALAVMSGALAITTGQPTSTANPLRTRQGRREFAFWLAGGLVLGLAIGLAIWLAIGLAAGPTVGLAAGFATALTVGLTREPGTNLGARAVIRSDAMAGLMFGLTFGLAVGLAGGLEIGLAAGLAAGLAMGLAAGLSAGLAGGARASRRYAVFLLCSRRRLPFRLGLFLDWAVTAGLMRYSGPAYQYRHRELQHWLRQHPQPADLP